MIRRTFLKALCASPLGFLIPKAKDSDHPLYCWAPAGDTNLPCDTPLHPTYSVTGRYTGNWWVEKDENMVMLKLDL